MKSPLAELLALAAVALAAMGLLAAFGALFAVAVLVEVLAWRPPPDAGSR